MNIGNKLRELRLENNLTQEELASRTELSKGYISQLENNITSPAINTLLDMLDVLGTNASDFFDTKADEKIVFSEEEYFQNNDADLLHTISWIVPNALKYEMEPIIIELEVKGKSTVDDPHAGEEFGYILEGEIVLVVGKKKYVVKKGETFYYIANKEHYIENTGKGKAKVLWISTPPMF